MGGRGAWGKEDEEFPKSISKDVLIFHHHPTIALILPSYLPNTTLKNSISRITVVYAPSKDFLNLPF